MIKTRLAIINFVVHWLRGVIELVSHTINVLELVLKFIVDVSQRFHSNLDLFIHIIHNISDLFR